MIGKTILHYEIIEKPGEGGMGVVYKAKDNRLERDVAIKFLPRYISANSEERERFKIEAKASAALNQPNISHIYAIEENEDEMFIVMELIDGIELKNKIKSGPISTDEVINITNQIAEGLDATQLAGNKMLEITNKILNANPNNEISLSWVAARNAILGRKDSTLNALKKVLEDSPTNGLALKNCAYTYARLGMEEEAIDFLQRAIRIGYKNIIEEILVKAGG